MKARIAFVFAALCASASAGEIRWAKDVEAALREAQEKKQPAAICFLGDEGFSERLDAEFSKESVQKFFNGLSAAKVAFDANVQLAAQYKVVTPPAIVYLNPEGKLLGIVSGYQSADILIRISTEVLKRTPREVLVAQPGSGVPAAKPAPGGAPPGGEASNPMVPVAGWMEDVRGEILREETGPVVQTKIKTILDELDRLIEENTQSSSSSKSKSKSKKQDQGSQSGESEGSKPGSKPANKMTSQGMQKSMEATRDGEAKINSPFTGQLTAWGQRVPVEAENYDVTKAKDAKVPSEYEVYLKKYFEILSKAH